ncbi:MAG: type IV pilin protein, partial [Alphaproteobacteria bacterium]
MIKTQKHPSVSGVRRGEMGFTLIELMVVVAIIAILASIGIPKMTAFIKTAETAEAVEQMGKISKAIRGYIDSHPAATPAGIKDALETTYPTLSASTDAGVVATNITQLIPVLTIANNAKFSYKISNVTVDSATRNAKFCIKAVVFDPSTPS